jgi:hypothetical protein
MRGVLEANEEQRAHRAEEVTREDGASELLSSRFSLFLN